VCCRQLTEADQELYKNFPLVVSDRWQNEIAETVFEVVNQEADKIESKRRHRPRTDEPDEIGMIFRCRWSGKEKERKSIYIAPFCTKVYTKRSGMDHTVLPANNTMPAFPS